MRDASPMRRWVMSHIMPPMAKPFEPVTLDTGRLALRFMDERDTDALFDMCSQPEVARYTPRPAMKARAESEQMIARIKSGYAEGRSFQLGIVRREVGVLIGNCVLFNFHEESRRAEIGYAMNTRYWGQGFTHEGLLRERWIVAGEVSDTGLYGLLRGDWGKREWK